MTAVQLFPRWYDGEREVIVSAAPVNPRAHLRERQEHAPHRAARQRSVTAEHGEKRLRRKEPHHEAQCRPRVSRIEYGHRLGQPVQTFSRNNQFVLIQKFDCCAKRTHHANS